MGTKLVVVLNEHQTIEKIKEGYSLSRYGDGEFLHLLEDNKPILKLQNFDINLKKKLIKVFTEPLEKLLIGIPRMDEPKKWVVTFHKKFTKFISNKQAETGSIFVSAFISRPCLVGNNTQNYFDKVKTIWSNREVILINFNRNLCNHYMFNNCNPTFIQVERRNCFSDYVSILNECKKFYKQQRLFLISAGPTATCLSYDLTLDNEQCIDIGQIALEYSVFNEEKNLKSWTSQNKYKKKKIRG